VDVKEYISSGILESYALGLVSDQERKEVECMSHIYPEIREELEKVSMAMEDLARIQQVQPPVALKNKIFARLANEKAPVAEINTGNRETKVVPLNVPQRTSPGLKWLAAACFIGLLGMGALYINERSAVKSLNNELASYKGTMSEKEQVIEKMTREQAYTAHELAMFRDPDFKTVFLTGTPHKPQSSLAIVCCNHKNGETLMAVENLPELPSDKQYQLWALVNGIPVDMGVLPKDTAAVRSFFKVKNVEGAQAFAITMEKEGGSPSHTIEEMYVMGAI
jgi:anti-sigma-K factor RskA